MFEDVRTFLEDMMTKTRRRRRFAGFNMGPRSVMKRMSGIASAHKTIAKSCTIINAEVHRIATATNQEQQAPPDAVQNIRIQLTTTAAAIQVLTNAYQTTVDCQRIGNNPALEWAATSLLRDVRRVQETRNKIRSVKVELTRRKIPKKKHKKNGGGLLKDGKT